MKGKIFRNENKKGAEKYLYFSAPFLDFYFPSKKVLIKNYILEPDIKTII